MTRVDFYHLQIKPLEDILPKLCEKAYSTGMFIKIITNTEEQVQEINHLLWNYEQQSFLPHGTKKEGYAEMQPIFISTQNINENSAKILILTNGKTLDINTLQSYDRVLNIFDGRSNQAIDEARQYWKEIKETDCEIHYWQQNQNGIFEQKV